MAIDQHLDSEHDGPFRPRPAVRLSLPAVAASVPQVRHAAVALAEREACTNVVMHAYRTADAPGTLGVHAGVTDAGLLEIVVADEGGGPAREGESPGLGLGMALMAAVTTGLELDHDGSATRVRLSFCLRGEGSEGGAATDSVADADQTGDSEAAAADRD